MDTDPLVLSFEVAFASTLLSAVVGVLVAALLANVRFVGRGFVDVLFTAPMVMPPTVLGYYLLVALGDHSFIGRAWKSVFGSGIVFTRTGLVVAGTVGALPIVIKSGRAALEGVDTRLILAARTLGAGPLRAFFTVQLPLATRGIAAGLMLAFARALGDFGVTYMVAGNIPGETQTAALAIVDAIQAHRERDALTMVVVLTVIAVAILVLANKLTEKGSG